VGVRARFGLNWIVAAVGRLRVISVMVAMVLRGIVTAGVVIARMIEMQVEGQRMHCVRSPAMGMGVRRRGRDDAKMRQGDSHADRNDPANPIHVLFLTALRYPGMKATGRRA
jgi:hypothetical protein